ncbi:helix-turn-helix domain-containing protein [Streptomyces hygroscopicus]|uniref:helix-turn-helix domain-containing protein n=1 Tax=Streptomyces hygroscopicus TaxID=1912 RepID=UPI0036824742
MVTGYPVTMADGGEFGRIARAALKARGMTIRAAARAVNFDHAYLSRVFAGKQLPSPQLAQALDRLFGTGRALVDLADRLAEAATLSGSAPPASLSDFLPEDDPLAPLASRTGRRIGMEDVKDQAQRVHALRLADDVVYGRDLIGPALRELRTAVRLYRENTHTDSVGRELLRTIGELAQICGWISADAGQHAEAERIYRLGLSAANTAGDATLAGNLLGSLAYLASNTGREREGVEMARAASDGAPDAPPRARALFLDRVAWANAKTGQAQPAMRALAQAHEAIISDYDGPEEPTWTYWVSTAELEVMDSRVFTELRRPLRAVPLLRRVLSQYDATHTREMALYLSWLAVALADANEPEEAAATTERVISLSSAGASERTADRARVALGRLMEYRGVPEVDSLLAQYPAA